jgi:hypothetical protein
VDERFRERARAGFSGLLSTGAIVLAYVVFGVAVHFALSLG